MCNFLSGLARYNLNEEVEVITYPGIDSHDKIAEKAGLVKADIKGFVVRWELLPASYTRQGFKMARFRLDEKSAPSWWTPEIADVVEREARARLMAMVVSDGAHTLSEGVLLACDTAMVNQTGGQCIARDEAVVNLAYGWCDAYGDAVVNQSGGLCEACGNTTVNQTGGKCFTYDDATVNHSGGDYWPEFHE